MQKRLLRCRIPIGFLTVGLAWMLAASVSPPAQAEGLYRWRTEDGVVSFTDDARRIPERYRDQAITEQRTGLATYDRYTPADPTATKSHTQRLEARLERLRAFNAASAGGRAPETAEIARERERLATVTLRAGQESRPTIELGVADAERPPIVVEVRRMLDTDSHSTRHVTVVRQGDRILSVVDPRKRVEAPSSGTLDELRAGLR